MKHRLLGLLLLLVALGAQGQTLLGEYRFEESGWNGTATELTDWSGNGKHGNAVGTALPTPQTASPARPVAVGGSTGTCGYASLPGPAPFGGTTGGAFDVSGLAVNTTTKTYTSVSFWMNWNGGDDMMPVGFNRYALWIKSFVINGVTSKFIGFTTFNRNDMIGGEIGSGAFGTNLLGWHHVVAVFFNGSTNQNQLYIDGVSKTATLSQRNGAQSNANAVVASTIRIGGNTGDTAHRFAGLIDEVKVYDGLMTAAQISAAYTATHTCTVTTPSGFNAFESTTAATATTGVIHTKVAATPFAVDVVALTVAPVGGLGGGGGGTAVLTSFTGTVKVELLDAHDNSGAIDAYGCRSTWTPVTGNVPVTMTFVAGDSGRKTVTLSEANAWPNVRVRMTTPASGTATRIGCSTDNFAIRPSSFASLQASDLDWQTAGTGRALANVASSGGNVHKAGRPFTIRATAVNASAATTSNYTGSPLATVSACAGAACSVSPGALTMSATAVAGAISTSATYSETGSFAVQLNDTTFAAVDAADGSTALERTISSSVVTVGRFVPDHFDLTLLATPVLRTFGSVSCAARSFTYLGQPFGYATVPQATVLAQNASGATTANYSGALWKLTGAGVTQTYAPTPASPALDSSAATAPALTSNGNGTGLIATAATDALRLTRPSTPLAPFNASIALTWNAQDATEAAVAGNGTITTTTPLVFSSIAFDAGAQMRFGVLRATPAYGSELVDLPVLVEARYWDGVRMATNTADQCTALPAGVAAMSNYQRNLAACKTAITAAPATLANGRTFLKLAKPGAGNGGSVDLALQLGATASGQTCAAVGGAAGAASTAAFAWLQGNWNGATAYDQNPTTRASFGLYRSPLVYQRENY